MMRGRIYLPNIIGLSKLRSAIFPFLTLRDMCRLMAVAKSIRNSDGYREAVVFMFRQLFLLIFQYQNRISDMRTIVHRQSTFQIHGISTIQTLFQRIQNCLQYTMHSVLFSADFLILHVAESYIPCIEKLNRKEVATEYSASKLHRCNFEKCGNCTINHSRLPFSKIINYDEMNSIIMLSCVAYFEAQFRCNHDESVIHNNLEKSSGTKAATVNGQIKRIPYLDGHQLSIGLASPSFSYKSFALGEESCSFGYHSGGDIVLSGHNTLSSSTLASTSYNSFDTVGCGLIYPPLSKSKNGAIFFTKNGILLQLFDLDLCEFILSVPFFPIVVTSVGYEVEVNYGINTPFRFNVFEFEREQMRRAFLTDDPFVYEKMAIEQDRIVQQPPAKHPVLQNPSIPIPRASSNSSKYRRASKIIGNIAMRMETSQFFTLFRCRSSMSDSQRSSADSAANENSASDDKESDSSDESEMGIATAESEKNLTTGKFSMTNRSHNNGGNNNNDEGTNSFSKKSTTDEHQRNKTSSNRSTENDFSYSSYTSTGQERFSNAFQNNINNSGTTITAENPHNHFDTCSGNNSNDSNNSATGTKVRRKKKFRRRNRKYSGSATGAGNVSLQGSESVMNMDNMDMMMKYESCRFENDDDHDWCEDSMAVELSSVDSTALNDFRSCGFSMSVSDLPLAAAGSDNFQESLLISSVSDQITSDVSIGNLVSLSNSCSTSLKISESAKTTESTDISLAENEFNTRVTRHFQQSLEHQQSFQQHQSQEQQQQHIHNQHQNIADSTEGLQATDQHFVSKGFSTYSAANSTEGSDAMRDGNRLPSSSSFMALADASRASDWLLQQAAVAAAASANSSNGNYQPYVQSVLGSFYCKGVRATEGNGWDSDRSIATSLFVEVESVDEDGSYQGYGKASDGLDQDIDFDLDQLDCDGRWSNTGGYHVNSADSPTACNSGHSMKDLLSSQHHQQSADVAVISSEHRLSAGGLTRSGVHYGAVLGLNLQHPGNKTHNADTSGAAFGAPLVCRRPFSSLSVCDSDDEDHVSQSKNSTAYNNRSSQGLENRYRKHHNNTHSNMPSVLNKRKRLSSKSASAAFSPPLFEVPSSSFRQQQIQLMQQKKSVEFGSSVFHLNTNNSLNINSSSDAIKLEATRHGGPVSNISTHSGTDPDNPNTSLTNLHNDHKSTQNCSENGNHSYFNYGIINNTGNNNSNKVGPPMPDRVEDGYDGASETGRCETDGVDEFESENDTVIVIKQDSNCMNNNNNESNEWDQPMEIQRSSKEFKEMSNNSSNTIGTNSNNVGSNIFQEFENAAAVGGKKRRIRSRKYTDRPSFDCS